MKQRYSVVHSDEFVVIVSKPPGLLTIPDRYDSSRPCLSHLLSQKFSDLYVVHRLDVGTSGLIVFARGKESHARLSRQFETSSVEKTYLTLVAAVPDQDVYAIDLPLVTDADRAHRTKVDRRSGKSSVTDIHVDERFDSFALLRAMPRTGRTHQIRVHLAAIGLPIVCDPLYGSGEPLYLSSFKRKYKPGRREERPLIARTALHAFGLEFDHPNTGERIQVKDEPPRDFKAALNQLRKHNTASSSLRSQESSINPPTL